MPSLSSDSFLGLAPATNSKTTRRLVASSLTGSTKHMCATHGYVRDAPPSTLCSSGLFCGSWERQIVVLRLVWWGGSDGHRTELVARLENSAEVCSPSPSIAASLSDPSQVRVDART